MRPDKQKQPGENCKTSQALPFPSLAQTVRKQLMTAAHLGCEGVCNAHDCAAGIHSAQVQGNCPHRHWHVDGDCLACTGEMADIRVVTVVALVLPG